MELSAWFHRSFEPHHEGPGLILLGAGVGLLTGLGAVLFHYLIASIHNAAILGNFGIAQNAREHTPVSPWGAWIILVPVIGALLVTVLVRNFAPEAQGAGVSQVLRAVHADRGHMRPVIAIIRPVATAITIGTGGSAGREGPAMQFGAAIGALVGHLFLVPDHRRIHLLGCGVGAGIAAVFNAPLGGWFLAMEVIVPDWRPWTVLSTLVATASASWVTQEVFGSGHLFAHAHISHWNGSLMLPTFAVVGSLMALMSLGFIRLMDRVDAYSRKQLQNPYARHMSGMLLVGILLYITSRLTGHYYLIGGSYAGISGILLNQMHWPLLLLLLLALKAIATSLTIGTGGSGGIFSPSLFMGAALGSCLGMLLEPIIGVPHLAALFALCGMAGMVAATTGALLSAPVMVVELTGNYHVLLPAMVTALTAFAVRRVFLQDSIYTLPLHREGLPVPENHYIVEEKMDGK